MQKPLLCFLLPTFAPLERESERATVCILHDAGAIALEIRVSLVDEFLDFHYLVQSLRPLSTLILQRIQCMRIASPCVTSSPLLSLSPPRPSFSTILISCHQRLLPVMPLNRHVLLIQGATRSVQEKELLLLLLLSSVILGGRRRRSGDQVRSCFRFRGSRGRSIAAVEYEYMQCCGSTA